MKLAPLFISTYCSVLVAQTMPTIESSQHGITEACIRSDRTTLELHRKALATLIGDKGSATNNYYLGLAALNLAMRVNGSPDMTNREQAVPLLVEAQSHFRSAIELDSQLHDAQASELFCMLYRAQLGDRGADLIASVMQQKKTLEKIDSKRPSVMLARNTLTMLGSRVPTNKQIEAFVERSDAVVDQVRTQLGESRRPADFWDLLAYGMAARNNMFMPHPRGTRATALAREALAIRADFRMASHFLQPFLTIREPLAADALDDLDWVELATDASDDGILKAFPDAVALQFAQDDKTLWFCIDVKEAVDPSSVGANIVIDTGAKGGTKWWGGKSGFEFDCLATAWVFRDAAGVFRGAVGVANHEDAAGGEMTTLDNGRTRFCILKDPPAIVLAIPRSVLGKSTTIRILGAVGSHGQWSDNIPNTPIEIRL